MKGIFGHEIFDLLLCQILLAKMIESDWYDHLDDIYQPVPYLILDLLNWETIYVFPQELSIELTLEG